MSERTVNERIVRSGGIIGPSVAETGFVWFWRIISLYCLMFGVLYWVRLIGVYDAPLWRFDRMPVYWQVTVSMLAVLYPFAASGLWMLASWGPVIWFICAVTEVIMYAVYPDLFGHRFAVVASHICVALIYTAFRVHIFMQKREAERQG
ncbi:DUF6163 family protein [Pseudaminobacter soli (ex Li et al. 2025)]|uniref:DUF6163 family protein n=1 Tax=Pseudaminobacter soli (ex Li et al. 2025) TaxID=1295366 RepID=UPI002699C311